MLNVSATLNTHDYNYTVLCSRFIVIRSILAHQTRIWHSSGAVVRALHCKSSGCGFESGLCLYFGIRFPWVVPLSHITDMRPSIKVK